MSILGSLPVIGGIVKSVFGDKEKRDQNWHNEQMQVYDQFSSEFRDLKERTWWDSLWDGINRTPRPIMTFGVVYLFYICVSSPATFIAAMNALQLMPYEGWVTLWMIIGFWFGTKAVEKMPKAWGKLKAIRPAPHRELPKEEPKEEEIKRKEEDAE